MGPHYHHSLGRLICFENYAAIITDHVKIMYIHDHASVHCILNSKTDSYRMSDWDYYNVVTEDVCFYKATRPVQIAILTRRKKNTSSFTLAWLFATPSKAIYLSEMHLNVCGRNWTQFKLLWTAERLFVFLSPYTLKTINLTNEKAPRQPISLVQYPESFLKMFILGDEIVILSQKADVYYVKFFYLNQNKTRKIRKAKVALDIHHLFGDFWAISDPSYTIQTFKKAKQQNKYSFLNF